jgi:hypothetical protein
MDNNSFTDAHNSLRRSALTTRRRPIASLVVPGLFPVLAIFTSNYDDNFFRGPFSIDDVGLETLAREVVTTHFLAGAWGTVTPTRPLFSHRRRARSYFGPVFRFDGRHSQTISPAAPCDTDPAA